MIGKVVYVGRGQVADARNGNLVSLRILAAEWNAMVDAWDDIREIAAKMARFARLNQSWPCGEDVASMARAIDTELDRVKTASVQQQNARPGNAAAMREALVKCREIALQWQADEADGVAGTTEKPNARSAAEAVIDMEFEINAALSEPPRNCDVGTAEEQKRRFNMFCKRKGEGFGESAYCAYECPCGNQGDCKLAWAQMPYEAEEGGAE